MLHGSQKHSAHRKAQRFEWLTKHFANTKAQGLDDSQKHSANTQKNKGYIQLHKIRLCCKQFSLPNSRQYCNSVQTRLTKMHAKAPTCFNLFNFHPVSTKFPINIEHVILTNRLFFVFRIATFLVGK